MGWNDRIDTSEFTIEQISAFSRGFDHGNYGAAYESTDWRQWIADQTAPDDLDAFCWLVGVHFGYWSTFENHEVYIAMISTTTANRIDAILAVLNDPANRRLCDAAGCVNRGE